MSFVSTCNRNGGQLGRNKLKARQRLLSEDEMDYFLKIQYMKSSKEVAELMSKYCKRVLTSAQIKNLRSRKKINSGLTGRFEKGHVSWNKGKKFPGTGNRTTFKPGNIPPKARSVGQRFQEKDGYWVIKVREHAKGNKHYRTWEYEHRLLWEQHNEPIPEGYHLVFIDQNKNNITLENLMLVSSAELLYINKYLKLNPNAELNLTKILTTKIQFKTKDVQRERTRSD